MMDKVTAVLDFYSVVFALGTALFTLRALKGGKNKYEVREDAKAKRGNSVWWFLFATAFATATASLYLKYFHM